METVMAGKLEGRVAVVTGSSSGNGRAISIALANEGAYLVCSDLKKSALAGGYEKDIELDTDAVITAAGGKSTFISVDASKADDVQNVIDHAVKTFGRVDIIEQRGSLHRPSQRHRRNRSAVRFYDERQR
jgi:NAD(P)-dependent dehydrogenase (short-subunit alcohol dehydrogenase family)